MWEKEYLISFSIMVTNPFVYCSPTGLAKKVWLVFSLDNANRAVWCRTWPTVPLEGVAASCHLMESEGLVRNMHTSSLWLYPDTSPAGGLLPFYSHVHLSSCNRWSPGILLMFLRLCWVTQQTFLDAYKWYAITEKQDHLCKVTGLQFPPQATSSDEEERRGKRKKKRATVCGYHMHNHFLQEGCLASASALHTLCCTR